MACEMARLPVVGPKSAPGDKRKRVLLIELYAELPALNCKRLCAESCGPVAMGRVEWQSVCRALGEERRGGLDLVCPILEDGLCAAHEVRPMLCRLWGLVETMKCPWGCVPERYLTAEEGYEFLGRASEISL
jgi:Fe-S-cluster containining protein